MKFVRQRKIYQYAQGYILISSAYFLKRNFIPFLIDAQAVIGKNPVIYYSIPARMFQGTD